MTQKNRLILDVDGFIAGPKPTSGYKDCDANQPVIDRINELRLLGWEVSLATSRNQRTHENDVGKLAVDTFPTLLKWIDENHLRVDAMYPKPWCGPLGLYVDDRAVKPSEFQRLKSDELLEVVRGEAFTFDKPYWREGSKQKWFVIDLRKDESSLYDGRLDETIEGRRELGGRSFVILPATCELLPAVMENLLRRGAVWTRLAPRVDQWAVLNELIALGHASSNSTLLDWFVEQPKTLSSRHFNHVERSEDNVVEKTSNDPKLKFELAWLNAVEPRKIAPKATAIENGYMMNYYPGGSLSDLLDRRKLHGNDLGSLAGKLELLWDQPAPAHTLDNSALHDQHERLVVRKSWTRARELESLLDGIVDARRNDAWIVNGERCGTLPGTIDLLIQTIGYPTLSEAGFWHGDFCPGNILLSERWGGPPPVNLLLIDPRGTIDGETVALVGDRRYDLAKLAHALLWGYDQITRGWRDVAWRRDPKLASTIDVHLRVWDEVDRTPQRIKLWNQLNLPLGDLHHDDYRIHALAALQLITCAPLHSDDPKRVVALVARGLHAAQTAFKLGEVER
jgi:capsule biosynthesis phosphatase